MSEQTRIQKLFEELNDAAWSLSDNGPNYSPAVERYTNALARVVAEVALLEEKNRKLTEDVAAYQAGIAAQERRIQALKAQLNEYILF